MSTVKANELISEFLDSSTISALSDFLTSTENYSSFVDTIATAFGYNKSLSNLSESDTKKLILSFRNNLTLLIQKTWVEQADIGTKDTLLYQLNHFLSKDGFSWQDEYSSFLQIINKAVSLMFGQNTDSTDFNEYTLRIDPEFGIFWWYISNLPPKTDWTNEKCRISMILGMYFLANY
ncbi:MAG: hypothetical protein GX677_08470 [Treponema sp.]|jgi:hypothetical protein|nr:hypothetical protein [Treponema sp.]